jgi:hypothetical protein
MNPLIHEFLPPPSGILFRRKGSVHRDHVDMRAGGT